jgi:hypothetical protein
MDNDQNLLSLAEIDFVQTSCRILDIDSPEMINVIGRKVLEKGGGEVRKVMTAINAQLDTLGARVEAHRRATPIPALSTPFPSFSLYPSPSSILSLFCTTVLTTIH